MRAILFIVLLILVLISRLLAKILQSISLKELKRRARQGDTMAVRLQKLAAYGASAGLFLWLVAGLSLGGIIVLDNSRAWGALLLLGLLITLLYWSAKPLKNYGNMLWRLASFVSLPLAVVLSWLQPLLSRVAFGFRRFTPERSHTGAYEKEDLLELIKIQHHQADNRISDKDLKLTLSALQFGDKTVSSAMLAKKSVKWVSQDETIGPLLMDELHETGMHSFPVVKDAFKKTASPEVVGTLYLKDLVDHTSGGRVRDMMHSGANFINEDGSLKEALAAFSQTHSSLLIVINNFEEIAGILTLELTLEQILGEKIAHEFDQYHDKRVVASRSAEKT